MTQELHFDNSLTHFLLESLSYTDSYVDLFIFR